MITKQDMIMCEIKNIKANVILERKNLNNKQIIKRMNMDIKDLYFMFYNNASQVV